MKINSPSNLSLGVRLALLSFYSTAWIRYFSIDLFLEIYDEKSNEKLSLVNVIIVDTAVTSSFGWKGL